MPTRNSRTETNRDTDLPPPAVSEIGGSGPRLSRRAVIGAGLAVGAVGATTLVSACGSSGLSGSDDELLPVAGAALGNASDVPAGGSLVLTVGKAPVALAKKSDGTVVAHTGVCTHQKCAVEAEGAQLHCPCHQSRFDAVTGAVVNGPATQPLAAIAITLKGDAMVVA